MLAPFFQITLAEAAETLGAALAPEWAALPFGPISTDSREVRPGDYFLALKGENFDGHAYCGAAVRLGAAGLIVHRGFGADFDSRLPVLRVEDTLAAYGRLARARREEWGGPVLAISGSVGKTTTRRILARALSGHLHVLEPIRNFNNLIGVPNTLLRLTAEHTAAVLELGMNMPGELAELTRIARPTVAGLTRIGRTHVGMFDSHEDLIEAKLSLFANTAEGVPLVVNAGCPNSRRAFARFSSGHPIITFMGEAAPGDSPRPQGKVDCVIEGVRPLGDEPGWRFDLVTPEGRLKDLALRHFGRHLLENIACAAAFLTAGGYPVEWIAEAVADFRTEPYRGQIVRAGDLTFILDCYNASPDSMGASLESLRQLVEGRRAAGRDEGRLFVVLADMLELGGDSRAAHEELLPFLRSLAPAHLRGLGPESARLAALLAGEGWQAEGFTDGGLLAGSLSESLRPGDWVYFKGSHGFALEKVAQRVAPDIPILNGH